MRKQFLTDESIHFPFWVELPTMCKTRTQSIVLPVSRSSSPHGAVRIEKTFVNRPVIKTPRNGLPGYYIKWGDMDEPICIVTGYARCAERHCELHYMMYGQQSVSVYPEVAGTPYPDAPGMMAGSDLPPRDVGMDQTAIQHHAR